MQPCAPFSLLQAYAVQLLGSEHVALGSDWDGCVSVPPGLDAAGVSQVPPPRMPGGPAGCCVENLKP